jgi:hypothetical protein
MSRFTEDLFLIPAGEEWVPRTPSQLLHQLGVRLDAKQNQRKAVASWLETNEPSPFLRRCLEMDQLVDVSSEPRSAGHSAA